jgi:hypothetical protein
MFGTFFFHCNFGGISISFFVAFKMTFIFLRGIRQYFSARLFNKNISSRSHVEERKPSSRTEEL